MKLDALDHPKTFDFAARLDVKRTTAIGHLELLWAFTGKQSAQGNIGKWPDGAIARACDWEGDPKAFIKALVDSRFVDIDTAHRLIIHDWHAHAPGWVRAKLKKLHLEFIVSSDGTSERSSDDSSDGSEHTSEASSEPSSRAHVPSVVKGSEGPYKKPLPLGKGLNGADAPTERKPRAIRKSGLDAWDRTCKVIDAFRSNTNGLTWADADKTLNDPLAIDAIKAAGGHKAIAGRTQFTQGEIKRLFRHAYESALETRKGSEAPSAPELNALLRDATRGLQ